MKERWTIVLMGFLAAGAFVLGKTAGLPPSPHTTFPIQQGDPPYPLQLHAARTRHPFPGPRSRRAAADQGVQRLITLGVTMVRELS